ncbi:protein unc-93 homolog B1 isoform X2 [Hemicordylus capensis]|uniref:protein unc-93 homolog B1 isoform X2 n=1 Tax=Hemicordylus capensis TaxID=884348 RepID=UPI002304924D|nr:protein unc-93 homolog B1 isoform X2 [Hemicordylus capensis]
MEPGGNVYREALGNGVAPDVQGVDDVMNGPVLNGAEVQLDNFVGAHAEYNEEEEERKYFRRKRFGIIKNLVAASMGGMLTYSVFLGLLQMQLILHYDETYREVKYSNLGLQNIDSKMLMGINVTPIAALLYTPLLIRFFGTKWMFFLAVGIYALFVSTNYWERYYTLVPSAVAIGAAIVPLWASMGNYITRMAQKYYEYVNYKTEHVEEQKRAPHGAYNSYIIAFQTVFYSLFNLSFVCAQMPMFFFLKHYLSDLHHTLFAVQHCGTNSHGILTGFNTTVLQRLPRSSELIMVESVLMGVAFLAMLLVLILCGSAYRPTEEIDLRSIGWGNIFQLPFKHMRDYRMRHLILFFIYSGFEVVFVCTGFALNYGVCSIGLEHMAYILTTYGLSSAVCCSLALSMLCLPRQVPLLAGASVHAILLIALFCWEPQPRALGEAPMLYLVAALWGLGSALNKTGLSTLMGILYEDKERQDFVFTIYHWWQALAIFVVYLWSGLPMKAKLSIILATLVAAVFSYIWMERKVAQLIPHRLPKIPKPRHKVRGYRYLENDSDETDSEREEEEEEEAAAAEDEEPGGLQGQPRRRNKCAFEQALEEEAGDHEG